MKKKPHGYWPIPENALREAREFLRKNHLLRLPCHRNLDDLFPELAAAINTHYGYPVFRMMLEEGPRNELDDLETAINYASRIKKRHRVKRLPNSSWLRKHGYANLDSVIQIRHGGYPRFRELLGEQHKYPLVEQLKNSDQAIAYAQKIMNKHKWKRLPGEDTLIENGYRTFIRTVRKQFGSIPEFRKRLQEAPKNPYRDLEEALAHAEYILKEYHYVQLPSANELRKIEETTLEYSISTYHGGFPVFRSLLNKRFGIKTDPKQEKKRLPTTPRGKWPNIDYAMSEAQRAIKELGYDDLPSAPILYKNGFGRLATAISHHYGGFPAFRALFNERLGIHSNNHEKRQQPETLLQNYIKLVPAK